MKLKTEAVTVLQTSLNVCMSEISTFSQLFFSFPLHYMKRRQLGRNLNILTGKGRCGTQAGYAEGQLRRSRPHPQPLPYLPGCCSAGG